MLFTRCITRTKGQAGSLAKKGIHEIEVICDHLETMGCKLPVVLTLGLVNNVQHFSGAFFQVVADSRRKKKVLVMHVFGFLKYSAFAWAYILDNLLPVCLGICNQTCTYAAANYSYPLY